MGKKTEMPILSDAYSAYTKGNDISREWLENFYSQFRSMEGKKHATILSEDGTFGKGGYFGYLFFLMELREYLESRNYAMACNTIHKMSYFVDFFRCGVYDNLDHLLREYLKEVL